MSPQVTWSFLFQATSAGWLYSTKTPVVCQLMGPNMLFLFFRMWLVRVSHSAELAPSEVSYDISHITWSVIKEEHSLHQYATVVLSVHFPACSQTDWQADRQVDSQTNIQPVRQTVCQPDIQPASHKHSQTARPGGLVWAGLLSPGREFSLPLFKQEVWRSPSLPCDINRLLTHFKCFNKHIIFLQHHSTGLPGLTIFEELQWILRVALCVFVCVCVCVGVCVWERETDWEINWEGERERQRAVAEI